MSEEDLAQAQGAVYAFENEGMPLFPLMQAIHRSNAEGILNRFLSSSMAARYIWPFNDRPLL